MAQPVVFRPRGGVILAWIAIAVCGASLVVIAFTDDPLSLIRWAWPILLVAWGSWLLYIRPSVEVTDAFVEIRNVLSTHRVPWGDVESVDTRYALTIHTESGRRIRAWAAPAPGARAALTTRREEVAHTPGEGETRRPSDSETSDSGGAAIVVRRNLDRYHREGGRSLAGGTTTAWSVPLIAMTALLVAGTILSLALPHA